MVCVLLCSGMVASACDTSYVDSMDHMNEGIKHYNNNQISKAIDELKAAIQDYPDNHKAHYQLGMIYNGRLNDYDEAIRSFEQASKLRDDHSEYHYYLGYAHQNAALKSREGKSADDARLHFNQAKEALRKAVDVDEFYAEAYYRLGQVHEELGEVSQAIDAYALAVEADATLAFAYAQLGQIYSEYAFLDEAAQVLRNGAENNPDSVDLRAALGNVYLEQERFLEAIDQFEKARTIFSQSQSKNPSAIGPAHYGRSVAHKELGDRAVWNSDVPSAKEHYTDGINWANEFLDKSATDQSAKAQMMQVGAMIGEMKQHLEYLNKGELPKTVVDQKAMLEERQNEGENP